MKVGTLGQFLTVIYRISPSLNPTDHICSIGKMKKRENNFILQIHFDTLELLTDAQRTLFKFRALKM